MVMREAFTRSQVAFLERGIKSAGSLVQWVLDIAMLKIYRHTESRATYNERKIVHKRDLVSSN